MAPPQAKFGRVNPLGDHEFWMTRALQLAGKGIGHTSPNPCVGAVLVRRGVLIGEGYHHQAGAAHAEIEALRSAARRGESVRGATLYVTLEPCCTQGRTPPCTDAILRAGIRHVVVAAEDPNPSHRGKGFELLRQQGLRVTEGVLESQAHRLNEAFNHWIVHRTPWVTVKTAMTLDGKIATASGESKWITGERSRNHAMGLRRSADAILVGINTVLADDPSLTVRHGRREAVSEAQPLRIVMDSQARTPRTAKVVTDRFADRTIIVVTRSAPCRRIRLLEKHTNVWVAPIGRKNQVSIPWLLRRLGRENVTHLLVEGGGQANASFLMGRHAHRLAVYWAPKVLGGRLALRGVAGRGADGLDTALRLVDLEWRRLGDDLFMTARVQSV